MACFPFMHGCAQSFAVAELCCRTACSRSTFSFFCGPLLYSFAFLCPLFLLFCLVRLSDSSRTCCYGDREFALTIFSRFHSFVFYFWVECALLLSGRLILPVSLMVVEILFRYGTNGSCLYAGSELPVSGNKLEWNRSDFKEGDVGRAKRQSKLYRNVYQK